MLAFRWSCDQRLLSAATTCGAWSLRKAAFSADPGKTTFRDGGRVDGRIRNSDVKIDHGESLSDEALAARALEMDEEAVNRAMADSEYESEFLDEMRRIVDGEANRQGEDRAVGGSGESVQGAEASPASPASPASQEGFSLTGQTEAQRVAEEARKKAEKAAKKPAPSEPPQVRESSGQSEGRKNERNASAVQGYGGVSRSVSEPDDVTD